jgi:hypothetical protein
VSDEALRELERRVKESPAGLALGRELVVVVASRESLLLLLLEEP